MEAKNTSNEESEIENAKLIEDIKRLKLVVVNQRENLLKNIQGLNDLADRHKKCVSSTEQSLKNVGTKIKEVKTLAIESSKKTEEIKKSNESRFGKIEGELKMVIDQKSQIENKITLITQNQQKKIDEIEGGLNDIKQRSEADKKQNVESLFRSLIDNFSSVRTEISEMRTEFESNLSNLTVEVTELKSEVKKQNIKIETLTEKVGNLENEALNHKEAIEGIKNETKSMKVEVSGLKVEVLGLKVEVIGLKKGASKLTNEIAGLSIEVADLKNGASGLKNEIIKRWADLFSRYNEVKKSLQEVSSKKDMNDMIAWFRKRLDQLDSKLLFVQD